MNLLKKTSLTLTPFLLSMLLITSAAAETIAVEEARVETPEETSFRIATEGDYFIGTWNAVLLIGKIKLPARFSFLPGGVLLHSGSPKTLIPQHLLFTNGQGAWEQNENGSFSIHYQRSIFWASDGAHYDDEKTTGILYFNQDNELVGNLTVGMVNPNSDNAPIIDTKISFQGSKINAIEP